MLFLSTVTRDSFRKDTFAPEKEDDIEERFDSNNIYNIKYRMNNSKNVQKRYSHILTSQKFWVDDICKVLSICSSIHEEDDQDTPTYNGMTMMMIMNDILKIINIDNNNNCLLLLIIN